MDTALIDRPGCCTTEPQDLNVRQRCLDIARRCGIDVTLLWAADRRAAATAPVKKPDLGDLTTVEWKIIKQFLPLHVLNAPGESPRTQINMVLYKIRHGRKAWRGLPTTNYPSGDNARQRHIRWLETVYPPLLEACLTSKLSKERRAEFADLAKLVQRDREHYLSRASHDELGYAE